MGPIGEPARENGLLFLIRVRFPWKLRCLGARNSNHDLLANRSASESDLLSCVLFPFLPLCWPPLFLPFSRYLFALFSPSTSALFCRAKCTAQSLERGRSRMDLSTKFGKEIPSRNPREKRSESETGRIRFRRVRFQTLNSVSFFGPHRVPGRELDEFLSAYYLCAKANSPSFSQNSPSLPQNSVRLSEFSSPQQYSRNSIPPVS